MPEPFTAISAYGTAGNFDGEAVGILAVTATGAGLAADTMEFVSDVVAHEVDVADAADYERITAVGSVDTVGDNQVLGPGPGVTPTLNLAGAPSVGGFWLYDPTTGVDATMAVIGFLPQTAAAGLATHTVNAPDGWVRWKRQPLDIENRVTSLEDRTVPDATDGDPGQVWTTDGAIGGWDDQAGGVARFIYDEDATPSASTFDTFATLITALAGVEPGAEVKIVSSFTEPPAGTYDLNQSRWYGPGLELAVQLADPTVGGVIATGNGTTFTNVAEAWLNQGLFLTHTSTTPLISVTESERAFYLAGDCTIAADGTAPVFELTGTNQHIQFYLEHGSILLGDDFAGIPCAYEVIDIGDATNQVTVRVQSGRGSVGAQSVRGPASSLLAINLATTAAQTTDLGIVDPADQPNMAGTIAATRYDRAENMPVVLTTAADWSEIGGASDGDMSTVQALTDILGARAGVGGGSVATDTIFDAKGDLAVGTGSNTSAKLTVGANDTMPVADSAETTGIKWAAPSTVRTALGLVIGTNVQAYDADLAAIAGLSPSNDDIVQRKAGAWTSRTPAQVASDLGPQFGGSSSLDCKMPFKATSGGSSWSYSNSGSIQYHVTNAGGTPAIGDYGEWGYFWLPGGTYTIALEHVSGSANGRYRLSIDGTNYGSLIDGYSAGTAYANNNFGTGLVIPAGGPRVVRLTVEDKATGSTYGARWSRINFLRTA